jgi:hypothetical protein
MWLLGMLVVAAGVTLVAKPAGKPPANPKVTIAFANKLGTTSDPGDNIFQDSGPYVGGTSYVVAEMQGYMAYLQVTVGSSPKQPGRSLLFRYPESDRAPLGCNPTTAPLFPSNESFVKTRVAWTEMWQLGAMQVGEVRAVGIGFYQSNSPAVRWMRDTLVDPTCYHLCSDMVVAYRQDLNHWQVATSLSRLTLSANAKGIYRKQADGTFVADRAGTYVYHPGDPGVPGSPELVEPGDVAQLGETVDTFQGNFHMRFSLTVYCPTNPPAPLTCADVPGGWPCGLPNK